jgi:hypothetical protein
MMYEVSAGYYGRKLITRDGPCQGLLEWPQYVWRRLTSRPIGLARAKALADAQSTRATVNPWMSAEVAYTNGKPFAVPEGWYQPEAQIASQSKEVSL